jgi:hypothetical protein
MNLFLWNLLLINNVYLYIVLSPTAMVGTVYMGKQLASLSMAAYEHSDSCAIAKETAICAP